MLTIGQVAAHAGVTVRAVRHYHQFGLLAEPERDASGYRRYDAQAVVDLIRIKTLADAGVPLARIDELLHAGPEQFAAAVADIDRSLRRKIRDLENYRRRIAELAAGERLFLPAEVVAILDRLRATGYSEQMVRIERDSWILIAALSPRSVPEWVAVKHAALDDPLFQRLYRTCDEALGWTADDPRLAQLAADIVAWNSLRPEHGPAQPGTVDLMFSHATAASPAWQRLAVLLAAEPRPCRRTGSCGRRWSDRRASASTSTPSGAGRWVGGSTRGG
ncbi:DNA-binding transcriptional regulator, MerR family [Micromonospora avicenniae]|uniref:DNA-binding transcriptional regulator, MerR family n=1 Tax=Micromonospora avicenniae TaxID=1198245 RepID=A0A1N7DG96_9ACTN|nr:DNA-binding transcriptional regulator, MerR family [Micromonospora avicenniae]